jgi:hypothetical protein
MSNKGDFVKGAKSNMRQTLMVIAILISLLAVAGCGTERYAQKSKERSRGADTLAMMKKQDVITLSKAGVSDSLIVTMMAVSDSWFQLSTQDVLDLKSAGVSDKVINAMVQSNEPSSEAPGERGYYSYPPYWYAGYYPFWYYPSVYVGLGYRSYRSGYVGHSFVPHRSYFGGRGFYGGRRR